MSCSHWFLGKTVLFFTKIKNFHVLAPSVSKVCVTGTISKKNILERYSIGKNWFIENLIDEIEKVVGRNRVYLSWRFLKKWISWLFPNINFPFWEINTILDNWLTIYRYKNINWVVDWMKVAGIFVKNHVWFARNITPACFFSAKFNHEASDAITDIEVFAAQGRFVNYKLLIETVMEWLQPVVFKDF